MGVSQTAGNQVNRIPPSGFDISNLWDESCVIDGKSIGNCNTENGTTLPAPLEAALAQDVESGYNKEQVFGLYLDYAATIGSKADIVVPSLGAYFGGDLALNNQFYNGGNAQTSKQITNNCQESGSLGPLAWYQLGFNSIRVPGLNFTADTTELCQGCSSCFTDSGTWTISLPLSDEYCTLPTNVEDLKSLGSLYIDLDGADGGNVTLSLPLLWVAEQAQLGYVECTGSSGTFVLGLPISQYYYLAYNMGNKTVTFVDLTLSDETENFIDGPELGGTASTMSSAEHPLYQALTTGILALVSCIYLWK